MGKVEFINTTEDEFITNKFCYKFMSLENALTTLNNKQLWFVSPKVWKDPFEKRFINATYKRPKTSQPNAKKYKRKQYSRFGFPWKDKVFCTCITGTYSCEAYWNTYSKDTIGIEFSIDNKVLLDILNKLTNYKKIYIGKVEYLPTKDIQKTITNIPFSPPIENINDLSDELCARLLLLKRNAYFHENEYRIILVKDKETKREGINIDLPEAIIDSAQLFKKVTLDPSIGIQTEKMLKEIFEFKYGFSTSEKRNVKSGLYKEQKTKEFEI